MKSINQILWVSTLSSLLTLGGCGGSSNSSSSDNATGGAGTNTGAGTGTGTGTGTNTGSTEIKTVQATVTTSNAQEIALAAARGIKKAVIDSNTQSKSTPFGVDVQTNESRLQAVTDRLLSAGQVASGVVLEGACESGTVDLGSSNDGTSVFYTANQCRTEGEVINGTMRLQSQGESLTTLTYENFSITDAFGSYTTNGSMTLSYTVDGYTITYSGFTWTDTALGESYSMDGTTMTCSGLTTGNFNCVTNSDWNDPSGETYRIESATVVGNESSGYDVTVTVYDTENGYVEVHTTSRLMYNCDNGNPGSGAIAFSGSEETSGAVNFDSCSGFTVSVFVNGTTVAESYSWSDI
ncbi:MAG: hypothetical protein H7A01_12340 [Hahellaceae bacterium]|nr:hypothetical protein [Hahellaceae bacterium]